MEPRLPGFSTSLLTIQFCNNFSLPTGRSPEITKNRDLFEMLRAFGHTSITKANLRICERSENDFGSVIVRRCFCQPCQQRAEHQQRFTIRSVDQSQRQPPGLLTKPLHWIGRSVSRKKFGECDVQSRCKTRKRIEIWCGRAVFQTSDVGRGDCRQSREFRLRQSTTSA